MPKKEKDDARTVIATNRKAFHNFEILDTYEAGLSLKGPEVKSLRAGQLRLEGSYARVDGDEVFLHNLHINPYAQNTSEELPPVRTRKLLLRRGEIKRLRDSQDTRSVTLVPLEAYFLRGWAKIRLAVAKGKKGPDKRESIKKRETSRELARSFKGKFKT
ncbi:MAG: SsrA-binding protein [Elusimicrobia bacterium GWA2_69_24]|nr:MAG: SsrA-binding protein [Elusimicrobia bacterium GWA2_69_24]OGR72057.1 MAG: SsrA-binding protein [Elusimicrobia bacterium GWC2_65_9]HBL15530.1 SsrA-binding protein [Elusimicrobiota bacterium]